MHEVLYLLAPGVVKDVVVDGSRTVGGMPIVPKIIWERPFGRAVRCLS